MAGITVFPIAEGAIMRVTTNGVRLMIELSPVEITYITESLLAAVRGSMKNYDTIEALKASLPKPGRRVARGL